MNMLKREMLSRGQLVLTSDILDVISRRYPENFVTFIMAKEQGQSVFSALGWGRLNVQYIVVLHDTLEEAMKFANNEVPSIDSVRIEAWKNGEFQWSVG